MRILFALAALPLIACVQGQESFDVTETQTVNFPGLPAAAVQAIQGARVTESHVRVDMHSAFDSLGGQGALNAAISQNSLSGSGLALIDHVRATIATSDGKLPELLWSEADVPTNSSEIELPSSMSADQLVKYLEEGPVDIYFYVTGDIPTAPMSLTHTIRGHMTVAVDQKL